MRRPLFWYFVGIAMVWLSILMPDPWWQPSMFAGFFIAVTSMIVGRRQDVAYRKAQQRHLRMLDDQDDLWLEVFHHDPR